MSVGDILEDIATAAVPQAAAAKFGARAILIAVAVIAAIVVLSVAGWWFFARPREAIAQAAASHAGEVVAAHGEQAATDAIVTTRAVQQQHAATNNLTSENDRALKSATGASAQVDPAFARALHDALCLRDAYQSEPDCQAVQTARGRLGAAAADAGGSAANR